MKKTACVVLALGVLGVSTGSLFVRLADSPALATAAYRMTFAFLLLAPFALALKRRDITCLSGRELGACVLAGFFLALHFGTWISSLDHTSVANSVVLVNTIPIWIGIIGPLATRERVGRNFWLACGLCLTGAFVLCGNGFSLSFDTLMGDGLALAGAFFVALYLMIGRNLRKRLSLLVYATICYGSASCFLWVAALASGQQASGFTTDTWVALACLAQSERAAWERGGGARVWEERLATKDELGGKRSGGSSKVVAAASNSAFWRCLAATLRA